MVKLRNKVKCYFNNKKLQVCHFHISGEIFNDKKIITKISFSDGKQLSFLIIFRYLPKNVKNR